MLNIIHLSKYNDSLQKNVKFHYNKSILHIKLTQSGLETRCHVSISPYSSPVARLSDVLPVQT